MCAYRFLFSEQLENAKGATGSCDSEVLSPAMIKTGYQSIYQSIKKPKQTFWREGSSLQPRRGKRNRKENFVRVSCFPQLFGHFCKPYFSNCYMVISVTLWCGRIRNYFGQGWSWFGIIMTGSGSETGSEHVLKESFSYFLSFFFWIDTFNL